ncbi:MAG: Asp-tRNA(Asn)/Glu-tRNA(Gln) amidotransferase subunit GatA [Patescibacteria group bacterium]
MMRFKTAKEIRDAIASGATTAVDVVKNVLDDIRVRDGAIGAFLETFDDDALARAAEIDAMVARGEELPVLAGVPVAIKDNMLYDGHVATSGSKILAEHTAAYSATVVTRLEVAGAIIVGRTNMDEFAMGSSTETSALQATKNPWDTTKIPGGSSGGSCVAVAAGFVPIALGSDTGGSIRQPAAMCGVVGMKPSYGRVSRFGLMAMASSLDQIGPFAHTVDDVVLALSVIEGKDVHDSTSVDIRSSQFEARSFNGLRVGVPKEFFIDGMDADVRKRVEEAIAVMKENGAEIVDVSLPLTPYALPAYYIIQPAEASSNLGRYDGMRYGTRGKGGLEESYFDARGKGFGTEVKRRIMLGTFVLSAGYYDAYYKKALAVRTALRAELDDVFTRVDVLVGPTSPNVAWNMGEKFNDPIAMYLADIFTVSANIAGTPGISVPCGMAHDLPVGLQFLAGAMQDDKALAAAAAYQALTDWHTLTPAVE